MDRIRTGINIVKNGLKGLIRNAGMGLVSTFTIAAVMLFIGLLLLSAININGYVQMAQGKLDEIIVYLNDDVEFTEAEKLINNLSDFENIDKLTYIPKEEAYNRAREMFGDDSYIFTGLSENPFSASIEIKIKDISMDKVNEIVNYLDADTRTNDIKYYQDIIPTFIKINNGIKFASMVISGLIIILSIFVISNIIKIAITSRRREIEIMKIVGASNAYIEGPFVIEGVFYSVLGSAISYFILKLIYEKILSSYSGEVYEFLGYNLVSFGHVGRDISIIFICVAMGIGVLGSLSSLRKYLRV